MQVKWLWIIMCRYSTPLQGFVRIHSKAFELLCLWTGRMACRQTRPKTESSAEVTTHRLCVSSCSLVQISSLSAEFLHLAVTSQRLDSLNKLLKKKKRNALRTNKHFWVKTLSADLKRVKKGPLDLTFMTHYPTSSTLRIKQCLHFKTYMAACASVHFGKLSKWSKMNHCGHLQNQVCKLLDDQNQTRAKDNFDWISRDRKKSAITKYTRTHMCSFGSQWNRSAGLLGRISSSWSVEMVWIHCCSCFRHGFTLFTWKYEPQPSYLLRSF